MISPDQAATDLAQCEGRTEAGNFRPRKEFLPDILAACAAREDEEGIVFWNVVKDQFDGFQSLLDHTGKYAAITRDDPRHYLAMLLWNDGWVDIYSALWRARAEKHPDTMLYLKRMGPLLKRHTAYWTPSLPYLRQWKIYGDYFERQSNVYGGILGLDRKAYLHVVSYEDVEKGQALHRTCQLTNKQNTIIIKDTIPKYARSVTGRSFHRGDDRFVEAVETQLAQRNFYRLQRVR